MENISVSDLRELHMYGTPPVAVAKVSQAVLFLLLNHRLDMKTAWSEFKDLLENPTDFMQ